MIYTSWDIEENILKLVILGHFLPVYPTKNTKILKNEKICWRYHHHFTHVYQKSQSYDVRFLRYGVRQNLLSFFVFLHFCHFLLFAILDHFLPFYPYKIPKNQNFEKMKKNPGDIIILHKCTKNHDHMLHTLHSS